MLSVNVALDQPLHSSVQHLGLTTKDSDPPVAAEPISWDVIPEELKIIPHWVTWRTEWQDGKAKKVPYNPQTGRRASVSDPTTWCTYEQATVAVQRGDYDGLGFVFIADDLYTFVDLDDCLNPVSGEIEPWAEKIVTDLASYTEISPSGTGLHIIVKASKPGTDCRKDPVEIYDRVHYATMTGQHLPDTPLIIEQRQDQLNELCAALFAKRSNPMSLQQTSPALTANDEALLAMARNGRNGTTFSKLWNGDTSDYGGDTSRADLALVNELAFWCGHDPERIERLFNQSALGQRDKWRYRADYRNRTIAKALERFVADEPQIGPVPVSAPNPSTPDEHGDHRIDSLAEACTEIGRLRRELDRYRDKEKTFQAMVARFEEETKQLNDHFTRIFAVLNNKKLGKSTASVALPLAFECESALSRGIDEDGWVPIYDPAIADAAGVSPATVSKKKKELQQRGFFEFDTYLTPGDPATGKQPRRRSKVRMLHDLDTTLEMLADPTIPPKAHGGKRERGVHCLSCGHAGTQTRNEKIVTCLSCGEILKQSDRTVNRNAHPQSRSTRPAFQDETTIPVDVSLQEQDEMRAMNDER